MEDSATSTLFISDDEDQSRNTGMRFCPVDPFFGDVRIASNAISFPTIYSEDDVDDALNIPDIDIEKGQNYLDKEKNSYSRELGRSPREGRSPSLVERVRNEQKISISENIEPQETMPYKLTLSDIIYRTRNESGPKDNLATSPLLDVGDATDSSLLPNGEGRGDAKD